MTSVLHVSKALAKRTRKSTQVNTSLQNQNLCTDLQRVAKRIRTSARKSLPCLQSHLDSPQLKMWEEEEGSAIDLHFLYWTCTNCYYTVGIVSFWQENRSNRISGLYLQPVTDLSKSDRDCWKQPAAWTHGCPNLLDWFIETGTGTYDSSKLLDERQIEESGGCWQSLLPLPTFWARDSEGGSASRVASCKKP